MPLTRISKIMIKKSMKSINSLESAMPKDLL